METFRATQYLADDLSGFQVILFTITKSTTKLRTHIHCYKSLLITIFVGGVCISTVGKYTRL